MAPVRAQVRGQEPVRRRGCSVSTRSMGSRTGCGESTAAGRSAAGVWADAVVSDRDGSSQPAIWAGFSATYQPAMPRHTTSPNTAATARVGSRRRRFAGRRRLDGPGMVQLWGPRPGSRGTGRPGSGPKVEVPKVDGPKPDGSLRRASSSSLVQGNEDIAIAMAAAAAASAWASGSSATGSRAPLAGGGSGIASFVSTGGSGRCGCPGEAPARGPGARVRRP